MTVSLGRKPVRLLNFAAALALLISCILVVANVSPTQAATWSQIWSDEFSGAAGTGVNTSNWLYDTGTSYPGGAPNWGTGEVEIMSSSTANVYQDGAGHLAIKPIRQSNGSWTSGRIETQRTDFAAPSGGQLAVEASIQQPNVSGAAAAGYWPAFWMLGQGFRGNYQNWPGIGEIDILEDVNGLNSVFSTLHCGSNPGGPCNETTGIGSGQRACNGCQTGYHTYRVEYDRSVSPEQIRWYLDGANYFTINSNQVDSTTWNNAVHHGFFVILNVAMGGGFPAAFGAGAPTSSTASGVPMMVDYVRVFTANGTNPTPTPTPTPGSGGSRSAYSVVQAESYNAQSGTQTEATSDSGGGQDVGYIANGDYLVYNNVDFGSGGAYEIDARVASGAAGGVSGLVQFYIDGLNGTKLGDFALANTGGWQTWKTVPTSSISVTGVHTLYVKFVSGQPADFVNINWFQFLKH